MEALKWIGYIVAAILVLSVIVGIGAFIAFVILIGGLATFLACLVAWTAATLKGICVPHSDTNR